MLVANVVSSLKEKENIKSLFFSFTCNLFLCKLISLEQEKKKRTSSLSKIVIIFYDAF